MKTRRAVGADARAIAEVHVRSWQGAYRGLMPDDLLEGLSPAERESMWSEVLSGDADAVFAAERDGRLVGFCAVAQPSRDEDAPDGTAEIGAIYIDPDMWRTGAGSALMKAALGHLRAGQWSEVTLWVLEENQSALHFYARFGFVTDGTRKVYERSGTTGIRLRRALSAPASH